MFPDAHGVVVTGAHGAPSPHGCQEAPSRAWDVMKPRLHPWDWCGQGMALGDASRVSSPEERLRL